ncbi:hypothetical protein AB6813_09305 [bacterium RCC_150]
MCRDTSQPRYSAPLQAHSPSSGYSASASELGLGVASYGEIPVWQAFTAEFIGTFLCGGQSARGVLGLGLSIRDGAVEGFTVTRQHQARVH